MKENLKIKKRISSFQIIILGFLGVILLGALILSLPFCSKSGQSTPFSDALFTSTSAVCVTGLIVRDTATHWSTLCPYSDWRNGRCFGCGGICYAVGQKNRSVSAQYHAGGYGRTKCWWNCSPFAIHPCAYILNRAAGSSSYGAGFLP